MKAVLVISHGSHSSQTLVEVKELVRKLKNRTTMPIVEYAFLEIETPNIPEGIDNCVAQGASEVIVTLNFLNAGRHVDRDIPAIVNNAKLKHPAVRFRITQPVGQHEGIVDLFLNLIA